MDRIQAIEGIASISREINALEDIKRALEPFGAVTGSALLLSILASACTNNGKASPEDARLVARQMADSLYAAVEEDLKHG